MTRLFVDVRGSTTIAEKMTAAEFSRLMSRFYEATINVLIKVETLTTSYKNTAPRSREVVYSLQLEEPSGLEGMTSQAKVQEPAFVINDFGRLEAFPCIVGISKLAYGPI